MLSKAFEEGKRRFAWWPDWTSKPAVILASGPSTGSFPVDSLKGADVGVIAIKTTIDKAPWAPVCYGCDAPWWVSRQGLPHYGGIRLSYGQKALVRYPTLIHRVDISKEDRILVDEPLRVGSGKNSGFQALNLAIQFGASKILLVGYDFNDRSGVHWYGRSQWYGASNPTGYNFRAWITAMDGIAYWLKEHGIDVLNASATSDIKCFRHGGLSEIIADARAA